MTAGSPGDLSVSGGVEAAFFAGDGSALTGLDPAALSAGTASIDIDGNAATAAALSCTDCIDGFQLDRDSVGSEEIATGAAGSVHVANNSLTASDLAPGSVDQSELAAGAVTRAAIANGAVGYGQIEAGSVSGVHIQNNSVGSGELAHPAVHSTHILCNRPLFVVRSAPLGATGWQATVYNDGLVEDAFFEVVVNCLED